MVRVGCLGLVQDAVFLTGAVHCHLYFAEPAGPDTLMLEEPAALKVHCCPVSLLFCMSAKVPANSRFRAFFQRGILHAWRCNKQVLSVVTVRQCVHLNSSGRAVATHPHGAIRVAPRATKDICTLGIAGFTY